MSKAQLEKFATLQSMQRLGSIINPGALEAADTITSAASLADRQGYAADFLPGWDIPLPLATGTRAGDMLPLKRGGRGEGDVELRYMHFSTVMSKSRRMPMLTASNIDGSQAKSLGRADKWALDGRIDQDDQLSNEFYKNNRLDKGHMVRREDPVWGDDAQTANIDTFHYSNACPQMDVFNQHIWLGLENYILQNAKADGMRVNVYTGPYFTPSDIVYHEVQIPKAFWKVVTIVTEDGRPSATAYQISQESVLSELEIVYGPYLTYQISIRQVMQQTGIDFGALVQYDGFSHNELESYKCRKVAIRDFNEIMI